MFRTIFSENKFLFSVNLLLALLYSLSAVSHNNPLFCSRSAGKERGQQRGFLDHLRF